MLNVYFSILFLFALTPGEVMRFQYSVIVENVKTLGENSLALANAVVLKTKLILNYLHKQVL